MGVSAFGVAACAGSGGGDGLSGWEMKAQNRRFDDPGVVYPIARPKAYKGPCAQTVYTLDFGRKVVA